jgi:hypothetical protein
MATLAATTAISADREAAEDALTAISDGVGAAGGGDIIVMVMMVNKYDEAMTSREKTEERRPSEKVFNVEWCQQQRQKERKYYHHKT